MIVHKHYLDVVRETEVHLPAEHQILHVGPDPSNALCIWVLQSGSAALNTVTRRFVVYGTGQFVPDGLRPIGTARMPPYIWHVFEVPKYEKDKYRIPTINVRE